MAHRKPLPPGSTNRRGYGWQHRKAKALALTQLRDGQPCAQCQHDHGIYHPMYRANAAQLDLSHNDQRTGYLGLSWAACNRRAAAHKVNRQRRRPLTVTSSIW